VCFFCFGSLESLIEHKVRGFEMASQRSTIIIKKRNFHIFLFFFFLTMRYCSGVEHIPVVVFVSLPVVSLMSERSSVFPREGLR